MMDFKFGFTWLFDKLGYMPKIKVDAGLLEAWPFPALSDDFDPRPESEKKKKLAAKKTTPKKPALKKATTRKPKAK